MENAILGFMSRFCSKCGKVAVKKNDSCYVCKDNHENWINPAIGSTVFVMKDSRVLYGIRSRNPGRGKLDLPGGFIELNESAEQTAIRETKEELGIDITLLRLLGTYPTTYEGRPILNLAFIATIASDHIVAGDDMSGGNPVWRNVEDLPSPNEAAAEWFTQAQTDFLVWWRHDRNE
jgi:ADP-ribose pyrophosphatase YjhB (NUDIX family)